MKKPLLSDSELKHLAKVIEEVEKSTSGEIRLMIVKRSSVTGHVVTLLWALLSLVAMGVAWRFRHHFAMWGRIWVWPVLLAAVYAIASFLSRWPRLQRWLTPVHDLNHQVWARAEVEFYRAGLNHTRGHTGVLIFVSRFERQAVVLADRGIASKTAPHAWDGVVKMITRRAKYGHWAQAFEEALRECGKYLSEHFPPSPGKTNELPNAVIVKD